MDKSRAADVSVVIPFYNGNKYIKPMLSLMQKNAENMYPKKLEVVLVNDSPDCDMQIEDGLCPDVNLRFCKNDKNYGIHLSRVRGISEATGEYILMLDQDDRIVENAISLQLEAIGEADIIVSNGMDENPSSKGVIYHSIAHQRAVLKRKNYFMIGCQIVSPGQCLIRRDAIPKEWFMHVIEKNGADDYFLWLLLLNNHTKWTLQYEQLYLHRNTGDNVSSDFKQMKESTLAVISLLKKLRRVSEKEERMCQKRLQMREKYEGKTSYKKWMVYLCYPQFAFRLMLSRYGL